MKGETNALTDRNWQNYLAVRNGTKTTLNSSEFDSLGFTGRIRNASYLFHGSGLTSVDLDFRNMVTSNQSAAEGMFMYNEGLITATVDLRGISGQNTCLYLFYGCTKLTTLTLNLGGLSNVSNPVNQSINLCNSINNLTLTGISNSNALWGSTNANLNFFAQTQLTTCQNLTITCDILPNLYLAVMTSLNLASVVQVLGQLHDYTGLTAHTITFNRAFTGLSQSDYDLIDAAKTTAEARNWTVNGLTYSL